MFSDEFSVHTLIQFLIGGPTVWIRCNYPWILFSFGKLMLCHMEEVQDKTMNPFSHHGKRSAGRPEHNAGLNPPEPRPWKLF